MKAAKRALLRAPFVVALALLLTVLLWHSALASLLPFALTPLPVGLWVLLALLALLAPAFLAPGSPMPPMLVVLVPVAAVASYEQSHLDWLRTLKDFHVTNPGAPNVVRLSLEAAAVLVAWAAHATDLAARLRERLASRGVANAEARVATNAAARRAFATASASVASFAGVVALGWLVVAVTPELGRVTFLMPVIAALLVALAAMLLTARRAEA